MSCSFGARVGVGQGGGRAGSAARRRRAVRRPAGPFVRFADVRGASAPGLRRTRREKCMLSYFARFGAPLEHQATSTCCARQIARCRRRAQSSGLACVRRYSNERGPVARQESVPVERPRSIRTDRCRSSHLALDDFADRHGRSAARHKPESPRRRGPRLREVQIPAYGARLPVAAPSVRDPHALGRAFRLADEAVRVVARAAGTDISSARFRSRRMHLQA